MHFIFVPIMKKHAAVFEILLNLPNMWSFEELIQILIFLKQSKWMQGIDIYFNSRAVK